MAKYHINEKGEPGLCKATKTPCPLAGAEEHYSSPESARAAYEAAMEQASDRPVLSEADRARFEESRATMEKLKESPVEFASAAEIRSGDRIFLSKNGPSVEVLSNSVSKNPVTGEPVHNLRVATGSGTVKAIPLSAGSSVRLDSSKTVRREAANQFSRAAGQADRELERERIESLKKMNPLVRWDNLSPSEKDDYRAFTAVRDAKLERLRKAARIKFENEVGLRTYAVNMRNERYLNEDDGEYHLLEADRPWNTTSEKTLDTFITDNGYSFEERKSRISIFSREQTWLEARLEDVSSRPAE